MINDKLLVSVIIPVYGVEKYLDRCLESVVSQTYKYIEIILVDDGSPDNCPAMCEAWAKKDSRIKVIHKDNGGLTSARKAGFDISIGKYVIFFDSDDYVEVDTIEKLIDAASKSGKDIAMCSYYCDTPQQITPVFMGYKNASLEKHELRDKFILPIIRPISGDPSTNAFMVTKLIKKEKIKEDYFVSEREYYTEDILFDIQIALDINGIAIVNKPLYHYCENKESLTFKYRENKFEMWNKRTAYFQKYFEENNWQEIAKNRITALNLSALMVGADNEVIKKDKKDFISKCKYFKKTIQKTGDFKIRNLKLLNNTQKVVFLLYYFNCYRILFYLRKKRVGV